MVVVLVSVVSWVSERSGAEKLRVRLHAPVKATAASLLLLCGAVLLEYGAESGPGAEACTCARL